VNEECQRRQRHPQRRERRCQRLHRDGRQRLRLLSRRRWHQQHGERGTPTGAQSTAQAGALDGGRTSSDAQGGNSNTASAAATGLKAFSVAQALLGMSFALANADGAGSTATATAKHGGTARAFASDGATVSATTEGSGFTAFAYASGPGASAAVTLPSEAIFTLAERKSGAASIPFERVDWTPFDIVSVELIRSAEGAGQYLEGVGILVAAGKPVAITGFRAAAYHRHSRPCHGQQP
jgi:hypothetical protein